MSAASNPHRIFRRLHESGCFVIPNPWDIGSARLLAQLGCDSLVAVRILK
jgi:2-methylisocitrate lyase-like PEP mutase family enzyme